MASGTVNKIKTTQLTLFASSTPQLVETDTNYQMLDSRSTASYITVTLILYTTSTATAAKRVTIGDVAEAASSDHSVPVYVNGTLEEIRYSLNSGVLTFQKLPSSALYLHRVYAKIV